MKRPLVWLALFGLFVAAPQAADATVISDLFNTGVDAAGVPLADDASPDTHYVLTPPGGTSVTRIRRASGGFPIGPWVDDTSISAWIGPDSGHILDGPAGSYRYDTTFTVVGNAGDASAIIGQWAADDGDALLDFIQLNGTTVATGNGGFGGWTAFTIPAGSPSYLSGINTLSFFVQNGGGPTGVRVEMVPEPSSIFLLLAGSAAVMGLYRRRTR